MTNEKQHDKTQSTSEVSSGSAQGRACTAGVAKKSLDPQTGNWKRWKPHREAHRFASEQQQQQPAFAKRPAPVLPRPSENKNPLVRISTSMEAVAQSMQGLTLEMGKTQQEVRTLAQRHDERAAKVARQEERIAARGIMTQAESAPIGNAEE